MNRLGAVLLISVFFLLPAATVHAQDWNVQLVDDAGDVGYGSQIVTTSDGTPYIAYITSTLGVKLAWWVDDGDARGWNYRNLTNVGRGSEAMEMRVDAEDRLHLVRCTASPYCVRYAIYDPETDEWILGTNVSGASPDQWFVDFILVQEGPDLIPYVLYSSDIGGPLYVSRRDPESGDWTTETVSDGMYAYGRSSIAADANGGLHVCFYEFVGDNLMYAYRAPGETAWALQTVDIEGDVGRYCRLILDDEDGIHIAYYDVTNGDLKFATAMLP